MCQVAPDENPTARRYGLGAGTMISKNLAAFLTTIAISEGTERLGHNHGYDVLCGGGLFVGYADHPRKLTNLPKLGIKSSAAGRYQIKDGIFDFYKNQLGLSDFSPSSQDKIAIQLIKECHATEEVEEGHINHALMLCASRWASLPGANYGQHENKLSELHADYVAAGGEVSA